MSIFDPILPDFDPLPTRRPPDDPPIMAQPQPTSAVSAVQTTPAPTSARATTPPVVPTSTPVAATTPPVQATTPPSSSAVVVAPTSSSPVPVVPSSSSAAASSIATTSSAAATTAPTSIAVVTPTATTAPSSSSVQSSSVLTITSTQPRPSLLSSVSASPRSSAAAASGTSESKGGIGGSGLSVGALAGIIIGGLAAIALVAFFVTRSMRKKARTRRTANRSSMFEPWPAPAPVALEDEPYEKSRFDAPSQSYAMQDQSYDPYTNAQQHAYGAGGESQPLAGYPGHPGGGGYPGAELAAGAAGAGAGAGVAAYNYQPEYAGAPGEYPPQGQGQYGGYPPEAGYAAAGMGMGAAGVGAGAAGMGAMNPGTGLTDGMMVRVKVGFVRTLEDELAITPDQQLYLHNQYDDGWSLCEDQNQNRGVVPVSCLEPWTEQPTGSAGDGQHLAPGGQGMPRSNTAESLTGGQRRSSLFLAQNAMAPQPQGQGQGHMRY